jgi:ferric-dicitrate binding protein FerR (iron transport regulator)
MVPEKIKELARKFLQGTASEEEKALLHQWYDDWTDQGQIVLADTEDPGIIENRILARLQQQIEQDTNPAASVVPMRKRNWWKMAAAASVLLILGTTILLWQYRQPAKPTDGNQLATAIQPGFDHARLTLPNGQQIILDSTVKGIVSKLDNTNIFNQNGQLTYKGGNDAGQQNLATNYNTITTGRGNQYQLILPDGSHVWLNAASSLSFPTAFPGKERVVELTGEAYFEIAKDKNRPFRVLVPPHPGKQRGQAIEVLGTHFNINAYLDEATVKTTLLEGSVKVIPTIGEQLMVQEAKLLTPGQQAQAANNKLSINNDADIEEVIAWKNGYFQFSDAPLNTVMRQASRWYDVDVVYTGSIQDEVFSGSIPRAMNISQLLKVLELTKTVKFRIEGKKIIAEPN